MSAEDFDKLFRLFLFIASMAMLSYIVVGTF